MKKKKSLNNTEDKSANKKTEQTCDNDIKDKNNKFKDTTKKNMIQRF